MGLSRWQTPLSVWAVKTGAIQSPDLSDVEAVQLGVELEDFVAKKFEKETGKKVRVDNRDFVHPDYPYMVAHIDRWVVGEDGEDLECKTCSAWKADEWENDEIPQEYHLQKNWYTGIIAAHRGKPASSGGYIAVLIGGQKFRWTKFQFSQELFDQQMKIVKDFWENYVLTNTAPMAIAEDKDTLVELFPESRPDTLKILAGEDPDLEMELNQLALERLEAKSQIKEIEIELNETENRLRQLIGDGEGIETGQFKVTWKSQNQTKLDYTLLREDGLYEKYAKKSTIRVLRAIEKKGKK